MRGIPCASILKPPLQVWSRMKCCYTNSWTGIESSAIANILRATQTGWNTQLVSRALRQPRWRLWSSPMTKLPCCLDRRLSVHLLPFVLAMHTSRYESSSWRRRLRACLTPPTSAKAKHTNRLAVLLPSLSCHARGDVQSSSRNNWTGGLLTLLVVAYSRFQHWWLGFQAPLSCITFEVFFVCGCYKRKSNDPRAAAREYQTVPNGFCRYPSTHCNARNWKLVSFCMLALKIPDSNLAIWNLRFMEKVQK